MTAIYQSPFLLALGWTIASSLWQTALLWMIYQVITNTNGKMSPAAKHNLALTAILCALGWFSITLSYKYNEFQQALPVTGTLSAVAASPAATADTREFMLTALLNQYLPYISASYLLVLVLLAARLIKAYFYAQKIKTKGLQEIDEYWSTQVEKYTGYLRIHKKVSIYLSSYIDVPATLNYFKPVILLPVAAFTQLTPQQVESVILHELAHIKRNDYLINIIVSVIETILFFNPFVHLLGKSLKKEREHCCDDFVLHFRFDPHSYASALLSLEKLRIHTTPVGAIAATGNSRQLLGRVKRIMNVKSAGFNYGQKLLVLLITACILISVAWLSPASRQSGVAEETSVKTAVAEEECMEDNMEATAEQIFNVRAVSRKPVGATRENKTGIVNVMTASSAEIKPVPANDNILSAVLPLIPAAAPSHPAQPHPTPVFEFHAPPLPFPANGFEMTRDQRAFYVYEDLLKLQDDQWNVLPEEGKKLKNDSKPGKSAPKNGVLSGVVELFRAKGVDLANHELKLHQLEQLLNGELFENMELNFESNGEFNVDLNMEKQRRNKQEGTQKEKAKERNINYHFNWNNDAEQQKLFYQQQQQLDSLKQRAIRMAEQQKHIWVRKTDATRQVQNALQQTYFSIIAGNDIEEKNTNIRHLQNEKKRSAVLAAGAINEHANSQNHAATVYPMRSRALSADVYASSVQQVSRIVIDTGRGNKTIVISIE